MIKVNITSTNKKDVEAAKTLANYLTVYLRLDVDCDVDSKFHSGISDSDYFKLSHLHDEYDKLIHRRKYLIRVGQK